MYRTRAKPVSSKPIFNAGTERFVRDWRSAIVTITVRDQRYRQHDPILGVVPLRVTDILQTSSQVTRWYPLDGGVGFGRIRISLLFRSIETRLPPFMLGWNVGTFEFTSAKMLALDYHNHAKLKMRTGGSSGSISKTQCRSLAEGDGMQWDLRKGDGKNNIRLPVRHRYRSPVVFEFHEVGKRHAQAYAILWLQTLVDNESTPINLPIWSTKNGQRLTQNYITEDNLRAKETPGLEDLEEVGRLQFRGRFKAGTDETHEEFISDSDTRETFESWEACRAEGVRTRVVEKEIPDTIKELHDESLTEGRDMLAKSEPDERTKWLGKDGTDWSGAFGQDPKAYMDSRGRKVAEPGRDKPPHDPFNPSDDDDDEYDDSDDSDSTPDLGIQDGTNTHAGQMDASGRAKVDGISPQAEEHLAKRTEKRKQRGLMQWKPVRNAAFAKDNMKYGMKRLKNKFTGGLGGREPDVETEI